MTEIHNTIKIKKKKNVKYTLEVLERKENGISKMYETVKKIKQMTAT